MMLTVGVIVMMAVRMIVFFLRLAERAVKHCRSSRTREEKTTETTLALAKTRKHTKTTPTTQQHKTKPASAKGGGETSVKQ